MKIGDHTFSPIFRRSNTSVTFRCRTCGLNWTITLANIWKVADARVADARSAEYGYYRLIADGTKLASENAARRKTTITRQKNRRVIRLTNG
jgi:hypothetical protein